VVWENFKIEWAVFLEIVSSVKWQQAGSRHIGPNAAASLLCRGIEPSSDATQSRGSNRSAKSTKVIVRLIARLCTRAGPGWEADPLRTTSPPTSESSVLARIPL
jgi:hypothetical protein